MGSRDLKEKNRDTLCVGFGNLRFRKLSDGQRRRRKDAVDGRMPWWICFVGWQSNRSQEALPSQQHWVFGTAHSCACMHVAHPGQKHAHVVKRVHGASWWQRAPLLLWLWLCMDRLLRVPAVPCADQAPGPPCFDAVCYERVLWCASRHQARATMH